MYIILSILFQSLTLHLSLATNQTITNFLPAHPLFDNLIVISQILGDSLCQGISSPAPGGRTMRDPGGSKCPSVGTTITSLVLVNQKKVVVYEKKLSFQNIYFSGITHLQKYQGDFLIH